MKKLMIAAATAAMIGGAFASAQVYEYTLNLTTTTCKEGKVAANTYWTKAGLYDKGDEVVYRTKTSLQLKGLTWGCTCSEALAGYYAKTCNNDRYWFGVTFWSPKADAFLGECYDAAAFKWDFINRIGAKCNDVEFSFSIVPNPTGDAADLTWTSAEGDCYFVGADAHTISVTGADLEDDSFELKLAGMGTITDNYNNECDSVIKTASGSVAGYLIPGAGISVCNYCEEYDIYCDVYDFCQDCCIHKPDVFEPVASKTVAFGTFTMKYNSTASKKLKTACYINKSYGFKAKSAVLTALQVAAE